MKKQVTGFQAGLTGEAQINIALQCMFAKGRGAATSMREIYEAVNDVMSKDNLELSYQGRASLRFFVNRVAVDSGHVEAHDRSRPGWRLTPWGHDQLLRGEGFQGGRSSLDIRKEELALDSEEEERRVEPSTRPWKEMLKPFLQELYERDDNVTFDELVFAVAAALDDPFEHYKDKNYRARVSLSGLMGKRAEMTENPERGRWMLTPKGREIVDVNDGIVSDLIVERVFEKANEHSRKSRERSTGGEDEPTPDEAEVEQAEEEAASEVEETATLAKFLKLLMRALRCNTQTKFAAKFPEFDSGAVSQWMNGRSVPRQTNLEAILTRHPPEAIKSFRKSIGVTQTVLGRMIGVTQAAVSSWETDKTNPKRNETSVIVKVMANTFRGRDEDAGFNAGDGHRNDAEEESEHYYEGGEEVIVHEFRLRDDHTIQVELPADLTPREGKRLAKFIKTLPL